MSTSALPDSLRGRRVAGQDAQAAADLDLVDVMARVGHADRGTTLEIYNKQQKRRKRDHGLARGDVEAVSLRIPDCPGLEQSVDRSELAV